jgi:hypothetical protein
MAQPLPPAQAGPVACLNCSACLVGLPGGTPRFCPACGQETQVRAPRLGEFLQQFGGAYLSTEGALWRTLRLLLLTPGELTRQYLAGRRKHYVLPLRLYLTISLITLLMLRVAGSAGPVKVNFTPEDEKAIAEGRNAVVSLGFGSAGLRDGKFYCDNLPGWVCGRVKRHFDVDPSQRAREVEAFKDRFVGNLGGAMFLLLPSFALWLKLVYWNRRLHYTEHLVFALHIHAFWFVALAFTLFDRGWLSAIAFTAVPWHTMVAMRRVYGGRRWPRFLRAGLVSLLYLMTMAVALGGVGIWALLA